MAQKKKPAASFAANAAKKLNPSEEAATAFLAVWDSPKRPQLFWDDGFNCGGTLTDECWREVNARPEAREALRVDMDKSDHTRFGLSLFTAERKGEDPVHLYAIAHRGVAILTGPEEINENLKAKLHVAGIKYAAQSDKKAAADSINNFLADGVKANMAAGGPYFPAQRTIETLIIAFSACEGIADHLVTNEPDGTQTVPRGTTLGTIIANAGRPENVMYTVDLGKGQRLDNIMNWETGSERKPYYNAAPVTAAPKNSPKPGTA